VRVAAPLFYKELLHRRGARVWGSRWYPRVSYLYHQLKAAL